MDSVDCSHNHNEAWQIRWRVGMQDEFQTLKVPLYRLFWDEDDA